jgi:hypothetical protein
MATTTTTTTFVTSTNEDQPQHSNRPVSSKRLLLEPDETALDLFNRCGKGSLRGELPKFGLDRLDFLLGQVSNPKKHFIVELEGDNSIGKTYLLMRLVVHFIANNSQASVIWMDLDQRLDGKRFSSLLKAKIGSSGNLMDAMSRIQICHPTTPKQVLALLHDIRNSPHSAVKLLVLDSLLNLYQFSSLTDQLGAGYHVAIPRVLFALSRSTDMAIFATKPFVPFPIVSKTWMEGVTYRISLTSRGKGCVKGLPKPPLTNPNFNMASGSTDDPIEQEERVIGEFEFAING